MARRRQRRRGVLLLVSLVLLVLFLMLGVTFVLMAGNYRRSSEAYQRMLKTPDSSAGLLDSVARDLVRGTGNPESPFSKENLLEDMYGQPALRGKVKIGTTPSVATGTGGQFTKLEIDADADFSLSSVSGYYNGLVLTMLTGNAAGQSSRIVDSSGNMLTVMTKGNISTAGLSEGDLILVNGRPFSGDGTGHAATATTRRLNEDYDAADLNNPWLATATDPSWNDTNFKWGSESNNRPKGTTWAVDNDGDGTKESLWIDVGLPLQMQSDGRLVKPLVAMRVRDLDGRVNLNAHGSAHQQTALQNASTPIGQGYGPAEIDPSFALGYSSPGQAEGVLTERHGADSDPGGVGDDALSAVAQFHHYGELAGPGGRDAFGTPHNIRGDGTVTMDAAGQLVYSNMGGQAAFSDDPYEMQLDTALGAPRDDSPFTPGELEAVFRHRDVDADSLPDRLQTTLTVGLDDAEKPAAYDSFRDRVTTESWDLPVHPVGLPEEVWQTILGPSSTLTPEQQALFENPGHITDLFKARMRHIDVDDPLNPGNPISAAADLQASLNQLITNLGTDAISPEMLAGLKFNVNRLFGNGQDDDNDGVVDEPGESGEMAYPGGVAGAPAASHFASIPFSYGDPSYTTSEQARQQYARQLYLLLMLVSNIDDDLKDVVTQVTDPDDRRRLLARRLAQFAANAVDYRDADSIMTGFEYDANPFDGWDADGDLDPSTPAGNDDIGVVWGTEAPAAVLTGTLALHDLRLKDGTVGKKTTDFKQTAMNSPTLPDPPAPTDFPLTVEDDDYDQYAPPEGSLFLQIHALPNAYPTRDLYQSTGELELSKTSSGDPVWRVAISKPHPMAQTSPNTAGASSPVMNQLRDQDGSGGQLSETEETNSSWNPLTAIMPDSTDPAILKFRASGISDNDIDADITLQRVVYFVNNLGNAPPLDQAYVNQSGNPVMLNPNTSIVVGPRDETDIRSASAVVSTITANLVCGVTSPPATWDGSIGMSVSEPVPVDSAYYNDSALPRGPNPSDPSDEIYVNAADNPFDTPLDPDPSGADYPIKQLGTDNPLLVSNSTAGITDGATTVSVNRPQFGGTIANYCTAFLQRLADPTQAYHVVTNPYLTVDMMPIDLTVYNGDKSDPNDAVFNGSTNNDAGSGAPYTSPEQFVQRGWRERSKLADPLGTLTSSTTITPATAITTASDPAPFWPNRPFVSGYELLMVPASEPGKLSFELGAYGPSTEDPQTNFGDGFPHLLNFFYEVSNVPRLGRIFDYLHVPSRYAGTQTTLRPDNFAGVDDFAPPFNRISNYREPGRVNLNTIEEESVWESVMHGDPDPAGSSPPGPGSTTHPGAPYANIQSQLFRSSSYAELDGAPLDSTPPPLLTANDISQPMNDISQPMFADSSPTAEADPFLRYGPINRLGNLVSTRSNVYAVWMTLGFFEVDSSGTVGNEAGSDTGEIERHRAFYLIDRSIPVGYENGQDHNTEDVFRVQRYIE